MDVIKMPISTILKSYMKDKVLTHEQLSKMLEDAEAQQLSLQQQARFEKINRLPIDQNSRKAQQLTVQTEFKSRLSKAGVGTTTLKRITNIEGYCPSVNVIKKLEFIFGDLHEITDEIWGRGICLEFIADRYLHFNLKFMTCDICNDLSQIVEDKDGSFIYEKIHGPSPIFVKYISTHYNKMPVTLDVTKDFSKGAFLVAVCPSCAPKFQKSIPISYKELLKVITNKNSTNRITQVELAKSLKTSQTQISKIANGEIDYIPSVLAFNIHKAYVECMSFSQRKNNNHGNTLLTFIDEITQKGVNANNIIRDFEVDIWDEPYIKSSGVLKVCCDILIQPERRTFLTRNMACFIVLQYVEGNEFAFIHYLALLKARYLCLIPSTRTEQHNLLNRAKFFERTSNGLREINIDLSPYLKDPFN